MNMFRCRRTLGQFWTAPHLQQRSRSVIFCVLQAIRLFSAGNITAGDLNAVFAVVGFD